ncbi:MAG: hypothetical protein WCA00_03485 [Candidatus Acidiferrales bacterium]
MDAVKRWEAARNLRPAGPAANLMMCVMALWFDTGRGSGKRGGGERDGESLIGGGEQTLEESDGNESDQRKQN